MSRATFVTDVKTAANGHWPKLLGEIGITTPPNRKHGPCPGCSGRDRFRLDDKDGRGTWICNQCGAGDGLDLVCRVAGLPVKEAAKLVAQLVGLSGGGLDPAERARIERQIEAKTEQNAKARAEARKEAAKRAADIMRAVSHGVVAYLSRKSLGEHTEPITAEAVTLGGIRFPIGSLVVPLVNEVGEVVNVQLITEAGDKRYLPEGQKSNAFAHLYGGPLVVVVEGYATGLSVSYATDATVYCAMDSGNLKNVAEIARRQHPDAKIIIAG
ncbi:MAG: primase-helicase zinc-binding domain-containing protein, partial [Aeromonas sp.]